ncbi:hypothetical protein FH972_021727 [Carpinus fangiana]|uniref:B-like cyclin n=1 Tax=Carpinus fangiana TaxID=176857 RepID=A0A5N6KQ50_9ROSI|nr:hypothetical protein FH972_021727 [Carpinus fangiana]
MPSLSSHPTPDRRVPLKTPSQILAETEAQWLFSEEEIRNSPSIREGMPADQEDALRKKSLNFITGVGIGLKLPQLTLYTAGIFLNRFFMRHSLVPQKGQAKPLHHYQIAAVALFLATKTEENCRKTKEIIIACCRVAQKKPELIIDEQSKDFWRWRDTLLLYEDVLLEALCFDLAVESPHKLLFELIKTLRIEHNKKLRTAAWSFVNDSALTTLGIRFSCKTIASAAVYCAARFCNLNPRTPREDLDAQTQASQEPDSAPDNLSEPERAASQASQTPHNATPWWEEQGVTIKDIKRACNFMAEMYADTKEGADGEASIYTTLKDAQNPPSPGSEVAAAAATGSAAIKGDEPLAPKSEKKELPLNGGNGTSTSNGDVRGTKRERDGTPKPSDLPTSDSATKPAKEKQAKKEEDDVGSEEGELEE